MMRRPLQLASIAAMLCMPSSPGIPSLDIGAASREPLVKGLAPYMTERQPGELDRLARRRRRSAQGKRGKRARR